MINKVKKYHVGIIVIIFMILLIVVLFWGIIKEYKFASENKVGNAVVLNIERDNGYRKLTVEYYDEVTGKKAIGIAREVYLDYANSLHIGKQISILYLSGSKRVYIPELKHPSWRTVYLYCGFEIFSFWMLYRVYRVYREAKILNI
ncbi:MAG: hypothetical protein JST20_10605 [Bacteroidetes bacterium]|nr:hypothetical protein [Bacteroidota bacterium]